MIWTILFLITKGNTDTRGVGLLEKLWKSLEEIIDICLSASISFHGILHGFCAWRGTGTAILALKLAQELASIDQ